MRIFQQITLLTFITDIIVGINLTVRNFCVWILNTNSVFQIMKVRTRWALLKILILFALKSWFLTRTLLVILNVIFSHHYISNSQFIFLTIFFFVRFKENLRVKKISFFTFSTFQKRVHWATFFFVKFNTLVVVRV